MNNETSSIYLTSTRLALNLLIDCFNRKWALAFLAALLDGPKHEADIAKKLNIRYRYLHITAKELASDNLIWHKQLKGSKTFYLTDKGRELSQILLMLNGWSNKWLRH